MCMKIFEMHMSERNVLLESKRKLVNYTTVISDLIILVAFISNTASNNVQRASFLV